jgi:hypothetical protein
MKIVFAPVRSTSRVSGPDLSVHLRRYKGATALEISLSASAQERVRYIDGDRVVAEYEDHTNSWSLRRSNGDESGAGYKVSVRPLVRSGKTIASFRVTCTPQQATAVLGARDTAEYEFLEVAGNVATFVGR